MKKENDLSQFTSETLDEMAMDNIVGGADQSVAYYCYGGYCVAGCGTLQPPTNPEQPKN